MTIVFFFARFLAMSVQSVIPFYSAVFTAWYFVVRECTYVTLQVVQVVLSFTSSSRYLPL